MKLICQGQSTKGHATGAFKNETSQPQTEMGKNLIKHSSVHHREANDQPKDLVSQPDLPPMLEEGSMNESVDGIKGDSYNETYNDNTANLSHNSSGQVSIPSNKHTHGPNIYGPKWC